MVTFLLLGLLLLATSVVIAARALGTRTTPRVDQIRSYGFGAVGGVALPDVGPTTRRRGLVARLGDRLSRRLGSVSERELRAELMAAGMYRTSPGTLLGTRLVAAVLVGGLLVALSFLAEARALLLVMAFIAALLAWTLPLTVVRRRARVRRGRIDRELPDLIDLLVVTVEAGLGFSASLRVAAAEVEGPLGDELRLTLQEETMGRTINEALAGMAGRVDTPAMQSFVRSVVQGETLGVSIGTIMRNLAIEMRKRRRQAAEERAQQAPVKLLFPLVFLIFPAIFIVLLLPALLTLRDTFS